MVRPSTDVVPAISFLRQAYDRAADRYDELWTQHVQHEQDRLTRGIAIRPGERIADLGCGTGAQTLPMLQAAHPGETVAVDASSSMLQAAAARAAGTGLPLTCMQADAGEFITGMTADSCGEARPGCRSTSIWRAWWPAAAAEQMSAL